MAVRVMEGVAELPVAIKLLHDQFLDNLRPEPPSAGHRNEAGATEAGNEQLTRSRTKESFARDWNDRLLSEYRLGCSEEGFESGTSVVTTNLGWCG